MKKRMLAIVLTVTVLLIISAYRVGSITLGLSKAVSTSSGSYTLTVATPRGTLYDCNMNKITNTASKRVAVLIPTTDTVADVTNQLGDGAKSILDRLKSGKPIVAEVPIDFICEDAKIFTVDRGVPDDCLAPHIVGYLDADGKGVTGIQRAYENLLGQAAPLKITYTVDATGRALSGVEPKIEGAPHSEKGVVLTLDSRIQRIVQSQGESLKKGAVIVMESATGKLRGVASFPDFSPDRVGQVLNSPDGALVNRALSLYNVGSVFKPCVALTALGMGISDNFAHSCIGYSLVGSNRFNCNALNGHGNLNMTDALAKSCNCYFIELGKKAGANALYNTCIRLGFNRAYSLCDGVGTSAGVLPSVKTLSAQPAALANFSFGQGDLMLSPLHIAVMTAAISNGGFLVTPSVIEGTTDGEKITPEEVGEPRRILDSNLCEQVAKMMVAVVENGTGKSAKTDFGEAGGKTATAETGWVVNGKTVTQSWFAGFCKGYTVVVLCEDGVSGSADCAPVFKRVCDMLAEI
ncbi:MAG: penicillin-binding protein 2 [Clostridia bacterium]|nr:penicillin-binding protein 2 [Clostridia bacterium]